MLKLSRPTWLLSCFIRAFLFDASGQLILEQPKSGPLDMRQTYSLTIFKAILKPTFSPWLLTKCETNIEGNLKLIWVRLNTSDVYQDNTFKARNSFAPNEWLCAHIPRIQLKTFTLVSGGYLQKMSVISFYKLKPQRKWLNSDKV